MKHNLQKMKLPLAQHPLIEMTIDNSNSEPVSPKAIPYYSEELPMGKG